MYTFIFLKKYFRFEFKLSTQIAKFACVLEVLGFWGTYTCGLGSLITNFEFEPEVFFKKYKCIHLQILQKRISGTLISNEKIRPSAEHLLIMAKRVQVPLFCTKFSCWYGRTWFVIYHLATISKKLKRVCQKIIGYEFD